MTFATVIDALLLPQSARVDKRVPKKLLLELGASTAADKRQIQNSVEEIHWIAALKPTNIGVQEYKDDVRHYQEIAVLTAILHAGQPPVRLTELIHRVVPYPVLLITMQAESVTVSLAHKRWSLGEPGKVVIEESRRTAPFRPEAPQPVVTQFLISLALSNLPSRDLFALYQGWLDRVSALEAAMITGSFTLPDSTERSIALHTGLEYHSQIRAELTALRAKADREKQVNRRVELNIEIKRLEQKLAAVMNKLTTGERQ